MSSQMHPDSRLRPHTGASNESGNPSILALIEERQVSRRAFLKSSAAGAVALAGVGTVTGVASSAEAAPAPTGDIGFLPVPANTAPMTDAVTVPQGYTARVLVAWGDSLTNAPHWDPAGAIDEATQLRCFGAHTDGMHYFAFPPGEHGSERNRAHRKNTIGNAKGLLVVNHEYVDPGLVSNTLDYALAPLTLDMVRAQQAGHGVSVVELEKKGERKGTQDGGRFEIKRTSGFNRRITGNTPCKISGPAAGHPMLQTAADPSGNEVLGTLNDCAHGYTPWGTYLACEENFNGYFGSKAALAQTSHERRYGITSSGFGYRWHEVDERFDVNVHRNEPNRFGWVVEVDPFDPGSKPVKRTALGRFKHESAGVAVGRDGKVAVYMGDDERNEYVYKFVCAKKLHRGRARANRELLDEGTLYVARFDADGTGQWLPLVWGQNGLTAANGFADQGEVLVKCRQAADRVGATMMDRPEWVAVHPTTAEVYLTLTNNSRRGDTPVSGNSVDGTTSAGSAKPPVDAANPRPDNDFGHIIRWRDDAGDVAATTFIWDIFVQCGDKAAAKTLGGSYVPGEFGGQALGYMGNINGDDYGAPDGLWFDDDGRLWIQTDQAGDAKGDWMNIGGNVMMCADPSTGLTKRFLTAPPNSEVTGVVTTPDGTTMFVGIQHPGEDWSGTFTANSTWPDSAVNGPTTASELTAVFKPRSSVVVITKDDGGVIGT